jgi:transcription elongation factor Elf1
MIKVLEEKPVPTATTNCSNCGSLLEYGNADLFEDYPKDATSFTYVYGAGHNYYFRCPVCGVKINVNWISKKQ